MLLEYVPQYRDDADAASARFPGDAPNPRAAGAPTRPGVLGWSATAVLVAFVYLLLAPPGRATSAPSPLRDALLQADRIDHPVFVAGVLLTAIGAAMVVVPLAYLLALRRSNRPVIDQTVRVDLGEDFLTLKLPSRQLTIAWHGVIAFAETRNAFVLKMLGDLRLSLPKRATPGFNDSPRAVEGLRNLLRRRIAPLADAVGAPVPNPVPPRIAA